jgi:predicted TIM-barrel fold metal-dependent hydrolase
VDTTTNGEFIPTPLEKHSIVANETALINADMFARKKGKSRRDFLTSTCGAASTLLAFNAAHAAAGKTGSFYDIPLEAGLDDELAMSALKKEEFIFDVQSHHVGDLDTWVEGSTRWPNRIGFKFMPQGKCDYALPDPQMGHLNCFTPDAFIKEMFMDSDTDMAVLTFSPSLTERMTLTHQEAAITADMVEAMEGNHRLLLHGKVVPNLPGDLDAMEEIASTYNISAWKTYTQYSVDNKTGWWLNDEEYGLPLIEKVRASGIKRMCIHKGLPLPFPIMGKENLEHRQCYDVGPAARQNPDITFIIFHSGYDVDVKEGPYNGENPTSGVDIFIKSLLDNDLQANGNVYAELGTTWRYWMRDPDEAAHAMGKLLKYVGEDRVLWGTDSIWYGSPQDQIQAFRTFQISEEFQEKYGYPAMTDEVRAKVFGRNAAAVYEVEEADVKRRASVDRITTTKQAYLERPDPTFMTYGPKTRREFWNLAKVHNEG